MKPITKTETIEKVVAYEASDGTRFSSEDQCREYEKTAKAVVKTRFNEMLKNSTNIDKLCDVPLVGAGCDWNVALVHLNSESELIAANMWFEMISSSKRFTDDMIGKDIVIGVDCYDDWAYVYGTIDECIKLYTDALMALTKTDEKKEEN